MMEQLLIVESEELLSKSKIYKIFMKTDPKIIMFFLYQIILTLILLFSPIIIIIRLIKKEDKKRFMKIYLHKKI